MSKSLDLLKGKPVMIDLWDRESSGIEGVGGGIEHEGPSIVVVLLDITPNWVVFQWKYTGQVVAVPTSDVVCIALDLPYKKRQDETLETGESDLVLLADAMDTVGVPRTEEVDCGAGSEQGAEGPSGSDGYNLFADMLERVQKRVA